MKNIAIILSGGTGTRLGANIPKQYHGLQIMNDVWVGTNVTIMPGCKKIGMVLLLEEEVL